MTSRPPKRRFQPDIASYSTPNVPTADSPDTLRNWSSPSPPKLPTAIQSSLLNVGMRIRKSVPEGYKTQITKTSSLLTDSQNQNDAGLYGRNPGRGYAELVPYCAVMKTGGYEVQSQGTLEPDVMPAVWFDGNDEAEELPSSQESVEEPEAVVVWGGIAVSGQKRRFIDEEDHGRESWGKVVERTVTSLSVKEIQASMALRPMAQARNRGPVGSMRKVTCEDNFEEATFLRSLDECMEFD
ncbi:MAG: hypothetical protein LQ338_002329 [Usnochroma carphineum]|nr:MAG: hypothetical protein LQ338_002329 [Usnochroma carphineum]